MNTKDKAYETHSLYNLSRYLYLKLESNYAAIVEKSGITLPQLRVLWIIKAFPGISLGKIAKIGCWSPPTVTNMVKLLINKQAIYREESDNKKLYKLNLTAGGEEYIRINKQNSSSPFVLLDLESAVSLENLNFALKNYEHLTKISKNDFIFDYIEKVNTLSLKIRYSDFEEKKSIVLKMLISLEIMLRTFVLSVENNHSKLLSAFKVTYPQIRALWILEAFPGITSNELSELGFWSPSTANLVVKNLFTKGLIYKVKGEVKNTLHLYVTDEGHSLLKKDSASNEKNLHINKIVEKMELDKLSKLNHTLYLMNVHLKNTMLDVYIKKTFKIKE